MTFPIDTLASLSKTLEALPTRPLEQWSPEHEYDGGFLIDAHGQWHHEGRPIEREALVRLFASVLMRDAQGRYSLVTPAERAWVDVEDLPFTAPLAEWRAPGVWIFTTNLGEQLMVDAQHPIRVDFDADLQPRPAVYMRHGLEARIGRQAFVELAQAAVEHKNRLGVWSGGEFFPLDDDV